MSVSICRLRNKTLRILANSLSNYSASKQSNSLTRPSGPEEGRAASTAHPNLWPSVNPSQISWPSLSVSQVSVDGIKRYTGYPNSATTLDSKDLR